MEDKNCEVCGSPVSSFDAEGTALAQHVLDRNDPHQTLALIPSVEVGMGPPSSVQGRKQKDFYVDLAGQRVYIASVSGGTLAWAPASAPAGVTQSWLSGVLAGYVSVESLDARLAGYVQSSALAAYARSSDLAAYATVASVQEALRGYVQASRIWEYGFVDSAALSAALAPYVTQQSLSALLSGTYLTISSAESVYATKEDLSGYVPVSSASDLVKGVVFRSPTSPGVYPQLNLDVVLQGYLTKSEAAGSYVTPSSLLTYGYVDSAALSAALAPYVTQSSLETALSTRLTQDAADGRYLKLDDYSPPDGAEGVVFRSPTSPGVYPQLNLDVVLQGYLTKSEAAGSYVTRSYLSGLGYVDSSALSTVLGGYVASSVLSGTLDLYLTKAEAVTTYVTPSYLSAHGYVRSGDGNRFVYRSGGGQNPVLDLDSVLGSWPAQAISAMESKPPAASAVYFALSQRDSAIAAMQTQVNNLSVTGGQSAVINVIEEPAGLQSNSGLIPVEDKAVNTIVMAGDWLERVSNVLTVAVPDAYPGGTVSRDFLVVLDFPSDAGTGQVPVSFAGFVTRTGGSVTKFSYMTSGLLSMTGIAYGMKVVYALTEIRPGVFAVTRKNLYEV